MNLIIIIASFGLLASIALIFLYFALLIISNNKLLKERRLSFKNSFPYEFYMEFPIGIRVALYSLLFLSLIASIIGISCFFLAFNTTYMLIIMSLYLISIITMTFSNVIPLSHYKIHIALSLISFFFFSYSALLITFSTSLNSALIYEENFNLPIIVILGVLGFSILLAMLNPRIKNWSKKERCEDNGKTFYVKPKINYLALYEWIFLIAIYFSNFLLYINIIVSGDTSIWKKNYYFFL